MTPLSSFKQVKCSEVLGLVLATDGAYVEQLMGKAIERGDGQGDEEAALIAANGGKVGEGMASTLLKYATGSKRVR